MAQERWEVWWFRSTKKAQKQYDEDPNYEHDPDLDEVSEVEYRETKEEAIKLAQEKASKSVYGSALVSKEEFDGQEWVRVGDYIDVTENEND